MLRKILNKVMGKEETMIKMIELSDEEVRNVTATGVQSTDCDSLYATDLRYQGVKEIIKKIHMV